MPPEQSPAPSPPAPPALVRERPIIFGAPMVRAVLDGRKTQTRRLVKPQPYQDSEGRWCWDFGPVTGRGYGYATEAEMRARLPTLGDHGRNCYGAAGDRLWVREAFAWGSTAPSDFETNRFVPMYAADMDPVSREAWSGLMRSPIHMPRKASRITLDIAGVRVQRLQDITPDDAEAEGFRETRIRVGNGINWSSARGHFGGLWEQIHGKGSWDANPWVWVIEFKRIGEGQ